LPTADTKLVQAGCLGAATAPENLVSLSEDARNWLADGQVPRYAVYRSGFFLWVVNYDFAE
jgi:hypothetical protein